MIHVPFIHVPKAPVKNVSKAGVQRGEWRGPCMDRATFFRTAIVPVWPEQEWPTALSLPFVEAMLAVPLRLPGTLSRKWVPLVWLGTVGDLDLMSAKWDASFGAFQYRRLRAEPEVPLDALGNSQRALQKWEDDGYQPWPSWKTGLYRRELPASHRVIADFYEFG